MCFYNQKRFTCGDWAWASFACRCIFERRIGEPCGIRLINTTEDVKQMCHLCKQIERKVRRKKTELSRLERWKREGATLVASMDLSLKVLLELDIEIRILQLERAYRQKSF